MPPRSAWDIWTKSSAARQAEPVSAKTSPESSRGGASVVDGGIGDSASVADYEIHDAEKQEDDKDDNGVPRWEAAVKNASEFECDEDLKGFKCGSHERRVNELLSKVSAGDIMAVSMLSAHIRPVNIAKDMRAKTVPTMDGIEIRRRLKCRSPRLCRAQYCGGPGKRS